MEIKIPNNWAPRDYQLPLWHFLENGGLRADCIWHRRGGKDSVSFNWTALAAFKTVGVYWHMLPTAKQARKVVWDGIDKKGVRFIDQAFPPVLRKSVNKQEMRIELINGSIWQCVGSDNYNSLIGANPRGVVFSEYSVANPAAWNYISPILAENGGWAIFIYTFRGRNHGWRLYQMAKDNPKWFSEILRLDQSGAYPLDIVEDERKRGMPEEMIEQEYFCSPNAAVMGAYYGRQIAQLEKDGQIGEVPWVSELEVHTAWDLGMDDYTVIWFYQQVGKEIRIIDYYANSGHALQHYATHMKSKPYVYGRNLLPHDVRVRELGTGKSRKQTLEGLGLRVTVVDRHLVEDGIQAVRNILPRCWFDEKKTREGLDGLSLYRAEYDEKFETNKAHPVHDWSSHAADGFRQLAVAGAGRHSHRGPEHQCLRDRPRRGRFARRADRRRRQ